MSRFTFLINEPGHKRWVLPDGKHVYNGVIFGNELKVSVWPKNGDPSASIMSKIIKLDDPDWKEQSYAAQREAEKLCPPQRVEFLVSSQGGGSIDVIYVFRDLEEYLALEDKPEEQRKMVLHSAWRKLWESDAKKMLEQLCNRLSAQAVRKMFEENAEIEVR